MVSKVSVIPSVAGAVICTVCDGASVLTARERRVTRLVKMLVENSFNRTEMAAEPLLGTAT